MDPVLQKALLSEHQSIEAARIQLRAKIANRGHSDGDESARLVRLDNRYAELDKLLYGDRLTPETDRQDYAPDSLSGKVESLVDRLTRYSRIRDLAEKLFRDKMAARSQVLEPTRVREIASNAFTMAEAFDSAGVDFYKQL